MVCIDHKVGCSQLDTSAAGGVQAVQSDAAAQSALFRPALGDVMAAALFAPFRAAFGTSATGMPPPPPRPPRGAAAAEAQTPAGATGGEDAIEMTPAGGATPQEGEHPFSVGDDGGAPLPDVPDYYPEDPEALPEAPPTGQGREGAPSGSKRARLSLRGVLPPAASGSGATGECECIARTASDIILCQTWARPGQLMQMRPFDC